MRRIVEAAAELSLADDDLDLYGQYQAKLTPETLARLREQPQHDLVLVTGMTPTTAGEGKTTTAIGLTQALCQSGAKAAVALREPSMGPVFGIKGGGTGGGLSQVLPADEINLHFTGDLHAVTGRQQPARGGDRQLHLSRQPARPGRAPHFLAALHRHERPRPARRRGRNGRPDRRGAARRGVRYHARL